MSEHTPGPWIVVRSRKNGGALRIEAPNDRGIPGAAGSVVRQNGIGIPCSKIGLANANLIAAAPRMLAALRLLVTNIIDYEKRNNLSPNPGREYCWDCVAHAVEVIAEATGAERGTPVQSDPQAFTELVGR